MSEQDWALPEDEGKEGLIRRELDRLRAEIKRLRAELAAERAARIAVASPVRRENEL